MTSGREVNVRELKVRATAILRRVEAGECVTVTRRGRAVAVLQPIHVPSGAQRPETAESIYRALQRQIGARLPGLLSFRLAPGEIERWLHHFQAAYPVRVVNPFGAGDTPSDAWLGMFVDDLTRYLARRMTFGDAVLAREADRYAAEAIVTWNVRDFNGRAAVPQ